MAIEGKTVVFTGKISRPRLEYQRLVMEHGGMPGSSVTRNTDYLVVGEAPGSKLARATTLGTRIISEDEFLKLLVPPEPMEEPLTPEELREIQSHIITLACKWCNHTYKQWDSLPNRETCPVCELLTFPKCPHCGNEPIFVEDFNLYKCMICGTWFEAPFSAHARKTVHLHLFCKTTTTSKNIVSKCPCGATLTTPNEYPWEPTKKYEPAYIRERCRRDNKKWVQEEERKWGERQRERQEKEEKALEFVKSLKPEQVEQLKEQLR